MDKPKRIVPIIILSHALFYCIFIIPIYVFSSASPEELASAIEIEAPVLKTFLNYPGAFGFPYTVIFTIVLRIVCYGSLLIAFIGLILLAIFYRLLQGYKKVLSTNTYKNQLMLFKALAIQLIDAVIFIVVPFIIVGFCASSRYRYSSYETLAAIFSICFHGIVDIMALIYFIKPYRQFVMKMVKTIFNEIRTNMRVMDTLVINTRVADAEGRYPP